MDFTQWLVIEEISNAITSVYCEQIADEEHADIIAAAKAGDSDAIESLWTYWQKEATAKVASLLGKSREDDTVQEIVSDVTTGFFERLMRGDIKAETPEQVGSYINTAVTNKIKDRWRDLARMRPEGDFRTSPNIGDIIDSKGLNRIGRTGELAAPGRSRFNTPDRIAMNREEKKILDAEIDKLPVEKRNVIKMIMAGVSRDQIAKEIISSTDVRGKSPEEVEKVINTAKSTIKNIRRYAAQLLGDRMKELGIREEGIKRLLAPLLG
ncbi:MAG: RNA polymerase sigma factor [Candidatus Thorarchaeota archaeon]|jgi:RNA polymerase sigma factor (sigma-70 family)